MSNPLLIHLTLFFILSDCLFITALFYFWLSLLIHRGQVFLNYFKNVKKSCEIFFWVLWEVILKVCFSSKLPRYCVLSFALHNFFMCPILLCFFTDWSIYLNSEFVDWQCDSQFPRFILSFFWVFNNWSIICYTAIYFIPLLPCSLLLEHVESMTECNSQHALLQRLPVSALLADTTSPRIYSPIMCTCACVRAYTHTHTIAARLFKIPCHLILMSMMQKISGKQSKKLLPKELLVVN